MKPVVAIAAVLPAASALRPRRLQNSMSMDPGLPLTELPIPSPGYPPCNICGEGGVITNPGAVLQIDGIIEGKTCAEFDTDGENGLISESECVLLPLETIFACDCQFDGIDPVPPPPPPPSQESCSCSPRDFTFQLQLDRDCDTNTINGSPGVEIAVCNRRGGAGVTDFSTLEIVDIQFLELNGLTVINQNDTFTNTSLVSGDTFSFPSISGLLSPGTPIGEQAQYFPTEVTLSLEGKVKDDDGNEVTVRNQVAWRYTEDCNILPISVGQSIGWVDIAGKEDPAPDFCPAAGPVPPTTTTTTTTATEATTTTEATSPSTTTTANIVTTTSSSQSMITTTAPPLFGKSGKGTKSPTSNSLKDPMAKVAKSVSDAKAEKVSSSKSTKVTKTSTKSKAGKMIKESSMSV